MQLEDHFLIEALRDNPVLAALAEADLAELIAHLGQARYAPGDTVITEGQTDRATYFVLEGKATILRGGVGVGTLQRGDHFGELELIGTRPRAATIQAATHLRVATLTADHYADLARQQPRLAVQLLQTFLLGLGERLLEVTESYGRLLGERSGPRRPTITVRVSGQAVATRMGTALQELLPSRVGNHPVVAGLVDRKATSLTTRLSSDCEIDPLTTENLEGIRVYRRSQALLLLEAARRRHPELAASMSHSVGFGQRVVVRGTTDAKLSGLARSLEEAMREIAAQRPPLREEWWTVDEARAYFSRTGWRDAAVLLTTWRDTAVPLVSYGEVYALNMGPLLPNAGDLDGFQILADQGSLLLVHGSQATSRFTRSGSGSHDSIPPTDARNVIAREALAVSRQTFTMTQAEELWLATMGASSVGAFNDACIRGDVTRLIRVSEGFQEKGISRIADQISDRGGAARVVCIAGPSSSGKTTFIKRLETQLQVNGVHPVPISLDNYYVDRDVNPRDEAGNYDYEAVEALQLDLLQDHLSRLLDGESVVTARYDFATGKSLPAGGPAIQLDATDVLMLEGIHGLNPRLFPLIPASQIFRVFICPLVQLPFDPLTRVSASDVRLLRRIIRDRHSRGSKAADNIMRWPAVRAGERKHIFPFQYHADAVFDSSLIYELAVLKVYAERYLLEVPQSHPAYTTAFRLLQLVDRFVAIYPDHVPPTSILREFIGESGFEY